MSASEQMRAMLDQLMGTARNGPEASATGLKFTDAQVCKSFLYSCCPHEILASTRMDLGECHKIHDLALRADYQAAPDKDEYFYDIDATEHLNAFIQDCDRRTELAKKRLAETQEELSAEVSSKAEKVHELAESIGKKLAQAEQAGAEGKVEESMKFMEEVEDIRKKKAAAEQEYRNSMPASSYQQQKLRVCEVCSAYLGIHDNDRRLADHFGGKLHLGFIKIREKLEGLLKNFEERKTKRREIRLREGASGANDPNSGSYPMEGRGGLNDVAREREREAEERDRRRDSYRRRSRSRSRDRHRRRRSRSRSRDRHRHKRHRRRSRSRSRSRDRRRRSRSRSRSRDARWSSRSRSRSRSRSHEERRWRRSRRSRSKRSKSKSRSRSRDRRSRSKRSKSNDDYGESPDKKQQSEDNSATTAAAAVATATAGNGTEQKAYEDED